MQLHQEQKQQTQQQVNYNSNKQQERCSKLHTIETPYQLPLPLYETMNNLRI